MLKIISRKYSITRLSCDAGDVYKRLWWSAVKDTRLNIRKRILRVDIDENSLYKFGKYKPVLYGFNRVAKDPVHPEKKTFLKEEDLLDPKHLPVKKFQSLVGTYSKQLIQPWYVKMNSEKREKLKADSTVEDADLLNRNQLRHFSRGWHGKTFFGRSVGLPELEGVGVLNDFNSVLLDVHKTNVKVGKIQTLLNRATVVIGNGNGIFGMGQGDSIDRNEAIIRARNNAAKYLYKIPIQPNHTIIHRVRSQMNHLKITFDPRPDGYGLRCHRMIASICKLAGIRNLHARLLGNSRKSISIIKATVQALATQETHDELAERTGCYVVEMKPENFNFPEIVAIPSKERVFATRLKRNETFDYDFANQLDPYLGLHRPKRVVIHERTTKKWKCGRRRMRYIIRDVLRGRGY